MKTKRFYFRKIQDTDLDNIYKGLSNPEVIKYYGVSFSSLEETKEQMLWYKNLEANNTGVWWVICDKKTDEFIGAGGFNDIDYCQKEAEVGFWLLPEYWGKGIMQEAMPKLLEYAFEELKLKRIVGFVEQSNYRCKRALSSLKFKFEKTLENCEIKRGKAISLEVYTSDNL